MNGNKEAILKILREVKMDKISVGEAVKAIKSARVSAEEELLFFNEEWIATDLSPCETEASGVLLLFNCSENIRENLRSRIVDKHTILEVKYGEQYRHLGEREYEVKAGDEEDYKKLIEELRDKDVHPDRIVYLREGEEFGEAQEDIEGALEQGIYSLFCLTKALMEEKPKNELRVLYVCREESLNPLIRSLSGFMRSANLENSKFKYKNITIGSEIAVGDFSGIIDDEVCNWGDEGVAEVRYEAGKRYERRLREMKISEEEQALLKEGGVYVITGGVGGLGLLFARYLSEQFKARLVLSDRREKEDKINNQLSEISRLGGEAIYVKCDVTNCDEVKELLQAGKERFGRIDGIIHAAGVLRDAFVLKKTVKDMDVVIGPKLYGAVNLDEASRNYDLDVFVLFSSLAGVLGNVGQTDYSYANRFLDDFAEWREREVMQGRRKGKTVSMNWPLWEKGGMEVDPETREWMRQIAGMEVLTTGAGIRAFQRGLASGLNQVSILFGDVNRIRKFVNGGMGGDVVPQEKAVETVMNTADAKLYDAIRRDVMKLVTELLKVQESDLDIEADMSEYGFDSISITGLANRLNGKYGLSLTPAVFFEHGSIDSMVKYLIDVYGVELSGHYDLLRATPSDLQAKESKRTKVIQRPGKRARLFETEEDGAVSVALDPIAVIGMNCVFPLSSDPEEFWRHIEKCDDLISEIPPDRWNWREYYGDGLSDGNKTGVRWGGFMREVDKFDAPFFNISPREAELMDPQQRIFLEVVWKTIEDAGYSTESLSGTKTGLFVGVSSFDYNELIIRSGVEIQAYTSTGIVHSILPNRISYLLNLRGPSEPVDTACSSSLVAIHRAVRAIQDGDAEMAIAGGVNVILTPTGHISFGKAGMLSDDGKCKTFDKQANGYVRGEGAGAVFLKPLSKAIRDSDHIYGIIRATAVNHGGHVSSLTVPNPVAQAELLVDAYGRAGIEARRIGYIECHGTGTSLGDPVEVNGLKRAFSEMFRHSGNEFRGKAYCGLGTVKTNIGHLEASAGIAGFIKVLLSMQHGKLPGIVHFKELNPYIELEDSPFYIVDKTIEWKRFKDEQGHDLSRVAGVSSFGFGGANAHIVLEEYLDERNDQCNVHEHSDASEVILLSAKDNDDLKTYAKKLLSYLDTPISDDANSTEGDKGSTELCEDLLLVFAETLGISGTDLDINEDFGDYGIDEVTLAKLAEKFNTRYDIDIGAIAFNSVNSIHALEKFILNNYEDKISGRYPIVREKNVLSQNTGHVLDLGSIAYTLQVGRDAMDERLALVVSGIEELKYKLLKYIEGESGILALHTGNARIIKDKDGVIGQEDESRHFIQELFDHGNFNKLAALWTNGSSIDWEMLYRDRDEGRHRIPLPTYPFKQERYWIPEGPKAFVKSRARALAEFSRHIYAEEWREFEGVKAGDAGISGRVVVLCNEESRSIADSLFAGMEGVEKIVVQGGGGLENRSDGSYEIDYRSVESCRELARILSGKADGVDLLLDLSDVWSSPREDYDVMGRFALLQGLIGGIADMRLHIIHVTRGLQPFEIGEPSLAGARTAGLVSMLGAEYSKVVSRTIDVDGAGVEVLGEIVIKERQISGGSGKVCYRQGKRYLPYLTEVRDGEGVGIEIDTSKTYVVTGGTRGIGAEVSRYLVERGVRKLVLMGREEIPERSNWEEMLAAEKSDKRLLEKIGRIRKLEEMGATVRFYSGRLTDEESLRNYFLEIRKELGAIDGIVHCAGLAINDHPAFINKTEDEMRKVFEPKVEGLNTLHKIFAEDRPSFFILFSSVSSSIPSLGAGVGDYACANAYMNYFAQYQQKQGNGYYKSIVWPNWKDIGMGMVDSPVYNQSGLAAHGTREGLELLENAMKCSSKAVVMPCVVDAARFDASRILDVKRETKRKKVRAEASHIGERVGIGSSKVIQWLQRLFSEELRMPVERLDTDTKFGELGVDSILMAGLIQRIEKDLGEKVDPSIILEYPTLTSLSAYVEKRYAARVGEMLSLSGDEAGFRGEVEAVDIFDEEIVMQGSRDRFIDRIEDRDRRIAVIGMACHFPQAENMAIYWKNLSEGRDCIVEVPESRWDVHKYYSPTYEKGKSISKWGGFIEGIEYFDPGYFGISEEEAPHIDPLVRQILEVSVDATRDAGYEKEELSGKHIGVFIGSRIGNYVERIQEPLKGSITGVGQNFIAAHVSHFFNFMGPNLVVDTACSSSLVSIHLAVNSLLSGESEMALAGGVDILLDEKTYVILSEGRALSPDGMCHTFDETANGFVPGEGCGAVLLKPLDKAIHDGDRIYGVIDATAVNNDGHTMGITTPNPEAQRSVIREALERGKVSPETITYVETHGTGTMIGDPIELKGLTSVFRESTDKVGFCSVGSVKTNVGHALSAAGVASFIKVLLCVHNKMLVPTLHCEHPNPRFDFASSPFYPARELRSWNVDGGVRRAGMSSFGFGGTNAHIIVSELADGVSREYEKKRESLLPASFNRKRFWLEKRKGADLQLSPVAQIPLQTDKSGKNRRSLLEIVRVS